MPSDLDLSDEEQEEKSSKELELPSNPNDPFPVVSLALTVLKGDGLVAKDKNILGQWTTSDPYHKVSCFPMGLDGPEIPLGKSQIIRYTLSPRWNNERFEIELPVKSVTQDLQFKVTIMDWDEDLLAGMVQSDDDLMGVVAVNVPPHLYRSGGRPHFLTKWYGVPAASASRASGRIQCTLEVGVSNKKRDDIRKTIVREPQGKPITDQATYNKEEEDAKIRNQKKNKSFFGSSSSKKDKSSKGDNDDKQKKGRFGLKRSPSKANVAAPPVDTGPVDISKLKVNMEPPKRNNKGPPISGSARGGVRGGGAGRGGGGRGIGHSERNSSRRLFTSSKEDGIISVANSGRIVLSKEDLDEMREEDQKQDLNRILAARNMQRNKDAEAKQQAKMDDSSRSQTSATGGPAPDGTSSILNLGAAYAANKDKIKTTAQQKLEQKEKEESEEFKKVLGFEPTKANAGNVFAQAVAGGGGAGRRGRMGALPGRARGVGRSASMSQRASRTGSMDMGGSSNGNASVSGMDASGGSRSAHSRSLPFGVSPATPGPSPGAGGSAHNRSLSMALNEAPGVPMRGRGSDVSVTSSVRERRSNRSRSMSRGASSRGSRTFERASGRDKDNSGPPITGASAGDLTSLAGRQRGVRRSASQSSRGSRTFNNSASGNNGPPLTEHLGANSPRRDRRSGSGQSLSGRSNSSRNFNYATDGRATGRDQGNSGPPLTGGRGGGALQRAHASHQSLRNMGGRGMPGGRGPGGPPLSAGRGAALQRAHASHQSLRNMATFRNSATDSAGSVASGNTLSSGGDLSTAGGTSAGSIAQMRLSATQMTAQPPAVRLSTNADSLALMRQSLQQGQEKPPSLADQIKATAPAPNVMNPLNPQAAAIKPGFAPPKTLNPPPPVKPTALAPPKPNTLNPQPAPAAKSTGFAPPKPLFHPPAPLRAPVVLPKVPIVSRAKSLSGGDPNLAPKPAMVSKAKSFGAPKPPLRAMSPKGPGATSLAPEDLQAQAMAPIMAKMAPAAALPPVPRPAPPLAAVPLGFQHAKADMPVPMPPAQSSPALPPEVQQAQGLAQVMARASMRAPPKLPQPAPAQAAAALPDMQQVQQLATPNYVASPPTAAMPVSPKRSPKRSTSRSMSPLPRPGSRGSMGSIGAAASKETDSKESSESNSQATSSSEDPLRRSSHRSRRGERSSDDPLRQSRHGSKPEDDLRRSSHRSRRGERSSDDPLRQSSHGSKSNESKGDDPLRASNHRSRRGSDEDPLRKSAHSSRSKDPLRASSHRSRRDGKDEDPLRHSSHKSRDPLRASSHRSRRGSDEDPLRKSSHGSRSKIESKDLPQSSSNPSAGESSSSSSSEDSRNEVKRVEPKMEDDTSMASFGCDETEKASNASNSDLKRSPSGSSLNNSRSNFEAYLNQGEAFKRNSKSFESEEGGRSQSAEVSSIQEPIKDSSRSRDEERGGGRSEHQRTITPERGSVPGRAYNEDNTDPKKSFAAGQGQGSPRSVNLDPENPPGFYVDADGQEYYLSKEGKEFYKDPITGGYYEDGFGAAQRQDNDFGFYVDADGRDYFLDEKGIEHYADEDPGDGDCGFFVDGGGREYYLDEFGIEHFKEDDMEPDPDVAETGFFLDEDGMEYYLDGKGQEYYENPMDGEFYTHPYQECERGQKLRIKDLPPRDKADWEVRRKMKQ